MTVYPHRAAERIVFREEFRDAATVVRNGGTLTGSPVVKDGVYLDGATQYVNWNVSNNLFAVDDGFTLVAEIAPSFAYDDGVDHYILDSTSGSRYIITKSSTNRIYMEFNGTAVANISGAVWGSYWNVGKKNKIVVSAIPGNTNVWLNGNQILVAAAAAWSHAYPVKLFSGASFAGTFPFAGTIHSLSIHSTLFTADDVAALESGRLWSYQNDASVWYDMQDRFEDPVTVRGSETAITDGDMETAGVAEWTVGNGATLTKETTDPYEGTQVLRVAYGGVANPEAYQNKLIVGSAYRITGVARSDGTSPPYVLAGAATVWIGTSSTDWQKFDVVASPTSVGWLRLRNQSSAGYVEFDDVVVIRTDEVISDGDMEATGVGEWTELNDAIASKETTNPVSGTQVIRNTYDGTANPLVGQLGITPVGDRFRVRGYARGDGAGSIPRVYVGGSNAAWAGTDSTDWQYFDFVTTSAGNANFYLHTYIGTGYTEWDQVSVRPLVQQITDKSNGRACLLGDGITASSFPVFQNPGFELTNPDHYMTIPDASFLNVDEITLAFVFGPDFPTSLGAHRFLLDTNIGTAGLEYAVLKANSGDLHVYLGGAVKTVAEATYLPFWEQNGKNVLVCTGDGSARYMYLNNHLISSEAAYSKTAVYNAYLWQRANGTVSFGGMVFGFYCWPKVLSPLQVADFTFNQGVFS